MNREKIAAELVKLAKNMVSGHGDITLPMESLKTLMRRWDYLKESLEELDQQLIALSETGPAGYPEKNVSDSIETDTSHLIHNFINEIALFEKTVQLKSRKIKDYLASRK